MNLMKIPPISIFATIVLAMGPFAPISEGSDLPERLTTLFNNHCVDCHDGAEAEAGLDLLSLKWNLEDPHITGVWVKIHDRLASGEMPPKEESRLDEVERGAAVKDLASRITRFQEKRYAQHGRAVSRRVNRFEYENILRDLLHDPHLKIADQLPLDGEVHGFAKVGDALDVSHVQVDAYLDAAEFSASPGYRVSRHEARFHEAAILRTRTREDVGRHGEQRVGPIFARFGGVGYQ